MIVLMPTQLYDVQFWSHRNQKKRNKRVNGDIAKQIKRIILFLLWNPLNGRLCKLLVDKTETVVFCVSFRTTT